MVTLLTTKELRQKVGPVEPVGAEAALYTDEDKVFCVKRMWAEGLTPTAASRLWGAPSRRTLAAWEKEALGRGLAVEAPRVPGACRRAKHARYPEETRAEALRLLGLGKPTREIARALGLPSGSVVSRWAAEARRRAKMAPEAIAMGKEKGAPGPREAELDRLRMECAVLREMLSDPKAGDPARLSNRQKAELGERLRRDYGFRLRRVTAFLRISKSSYEYERRALAAPRRDDGALAARVARAFASLGGMCGYRKVAACIRAGADGEPPAPAPERRVRRAMREGGMSARGRRAGRRFSSYAGEVDGGRPANVPRERAVARREAGEDFRLAHDFSAGAPGELLVTDVTELSLNGFKTYLSPVIDCWDGCPVGFSVSAHPDGGACYRTGRWKSALAAAGASRSMSRKGTCPDNARAEGFFGTLKQEFLYGREWAGVGREEFEGLLSGYMGWYVGRRPRRFREGGRARYETLAEHRRRLGYPVPPFAAQQAQLDWSRFLGRKNKLLQATSRSRSHGAL